MQDGLNLPAAYALAVTEILSLKSELARVTAELAEARKDAPDAKRYRLVRQYPKNFGTEAWANVLPLKTHYIITSERLDAAIDAAKGTA